MQCSVSRAGSCLLVGRCSCVSAAAACAHVQGTATQWDWRRVEQQLLAVHLSTPGLQLRLLGKLEEAAGHLINTARVSMHVAMCKGFTLCTCLKQPLQCGCSTQLPHYAQRHAHGYSYSPAADIVAVLHNRRIYSLTWAAAVLCYDKMCVAALLVLLQVLGQQPYSSENQLEACGGAGPSQASKSAGAAMAGELGPTTCSFAVNTLGKMHGMGGNKAWVRPH